MSVAALLINRTPMMTIMAHVENVPNLLKLPTVIATTRLEKQITRWLRS